MTENREIEKETYRCVKVNLKMAFRNKEQLLLGNEIKLLSSVVAQLVEWLPPTPEVRDSNPNSNTNCQVFWQLQFRKKIKIKEKEAHL